MKAEKIKPIPKYIKERIHNELSPFLNEDKIINYIHRFCLRHIKRNEKGNVGKIRFLSSPTPLGFHTHYDTIFEMAENIVNITDETSFVGTIILGVIKSYALKEKIEIIACLNREEIFRGKTRRVESFQGTGNGMGD